MMSFDFPVDVVYTWVDGSDPEWRKKKDSYAQPKQSENASGVMSECRFRDNNELLYSLRSIAKYASWVNRVFIVTDNQVPSFINEENVTIIDHKDIFPAPSYLPSFNSCAIELCLPRATEVSEHFLAFNDDFMLGNRVSKSDFFDKSGEPIIWGATEKKSMADCLRIDDQMSDLDCVFAQTRKAFMDKGLGFAPVKFRHTPKPIKKSLVNEMIGQFHEEYEQTLNNKFRARNDFAPPLAYILYCLNRNAGDMVNLGGASKVFSLLKNDLKHIETCADSRRYKKRLAAIKWLKPKTFCINDTEETTEEDTLTTQEFLKSMFPESCKYERAFSA
ncbi:Stealth CR1 domain-containing protein [Halodesulfovibrio sp.]|jgi:hypothetical protein|uniref:Stealth CR1 domain-containing protein n=1 Tax=Halodesulfovibrio sp. TaxID=1912772 RepID=UPI0025EEAD7D|nr:Stealth CR1 domain-containing protein [Halodesulfovibrio sp.]MCT4626577.1 Stealth CR1 domain-containing protein [Halodesulfovibrio sp.]